MPRQNRNDARLAARLKAGDAAVFTTLYTRHMPAMIRVAGTFVTDRATAEEVAQDTWLAVLREIPEFDGRSSLAGWIFARLVDTAQLRAEREGRMVAFDARSPEGDLADAFDATGHWRDQPAAWDAITPERIVDGRKLAEHLQAAIDELPPAQRAVIVLRVQQGLDPAEVCAALGISEGNMRVLVHRARLTLRARLDALL